MASPSNRTDTESPSEWDILLAEGADDDTTSPYITRAERNQMQQPHQQQAVPQHQMMHHSQHHHHQQQQHQQHPHPHPHQHQHQQHHLPQQPLHHQTVGDPHAGMGEEAPPRTPVVPPSTSSEKIPKINTQGPAYPGIGHRGPTLPMQSSAPATSGPLHLADKAMRDTGIMQLSAQLASALKQKLNTDDATQVSAIAEMLIQVTMQPQSREANMEQLRESQRHWAESEIEFSAHMPDCQTPVAERPLTPDNFVSPSNGTGNTKTLSKQSRSISRTDSKRSVKEPERKGLSRLAKKSHIYNTHSSTGNGSGYHRMTQHRDQHGQSATERDQSQTAMQDREHRHQSFDQITSAAEFNQSHGHGHSHGHSATSQPHASLPSLSSSGQSAPRASHDHRRKVPAVSYSSNPTKNRHRAPQGTSRGSRMGSEKSAFSDTSSVTSSNLLE